MKDTSWSRIKDVFAEATELDEASRRRFLDSTCADDPALRKEVESLLAANAEAGAFLNGSSVQTLSDALGVMNRPSTQQASLHFDETEPAQIGRYRLLERIGEGGFGVVYRAEQVEPVKRQLALKIIKPGMDTRRVVARFGAERQVLALMDHPNIARVVDAGASDSGHPYFVMELVDGAPITTYCKNHACPIHARLELFLAICDAVQHAHQKGVIHRDLKPSNLLIAEGDGKPAPKVIDFGVAKALHERVTEQTLTQPIQLIGTPQYMSPEQADATRDVDTRSDIYSLGVVLYELLAARPPFEAEQWRAASHSEILKMIGERVPSHPSQHRAALRGDLDWIILKAIEKDRDRRYASVGALAEDIRRHLRDEPVSAGPPSRAYRFQKFARRNRVLFGASAFSFAALLIAFTIALTAYFQLKQERDRVVRAEQDATAQKERAITAYHQLAAEQNRVKRAEQEALAQKEAAEQQARVAEAVVDFLTDDLLGGVNPENTADPNVTVRSILDVASKKLANEMGEDPLVAAEIHRTMGRTYRELAQYENAESHLNQALALFRNELSADALKVHDTLNHLAILYDMQGRYEESLPIHEKLVEIRRNTLGLDHRETLTSLNNLAETYADLGRYDEAERAFLEVLAVRKQLLGDDHADTLGSMNNLGSLYWQQEKYAEAEPLYLDALARRRRLLGDDHPHTLNSIGNLATLYINTGRLDEATPLLEEKIERTARVLGDDHPDMLTTRNNMAALYYRQGKFAEAEQEFAAVTRAMSASLGPDHWKVGSATSNQAMCLMKIGRFDEAEEKLLAAYAIMEQSLGADHARATSIAKMIAGLYEKLGKTDDVAAWWEKAGVAAP